MKTNGLLTVEYGCAMDQEGNCVAKADRDYSNRLKPTQRDDNIAFIVEAWNNYDRVVAERDELLAGIKDGEFLMRKAAINWKEAGSMVDSFKRWADQAREVIAKLEVK